MTEQSGAADHDEVREKRKQTPEEIVRRLQARIVKAQEMGKWNKARALQFLLTRSQSARILAVERVTENGPNCTASLTGR